MKITNPWNALNRGMLALPLSRPDTPDNLGRRDLSRPTARYASRMAEVSAAHLQDDTLGVLTRVLNGEDLRVTIDGRAVALLRALERPGTWMKRDDFRQALCRAPG
jgi:antitoxin (DNA-binding transcriptional repressor) of toxin-antitoxin stability system